MTATPGILFTAFEPSGDALGGHLIAALRQREPNLPIYAMGGPRMEQAGATLIESTTEHAVMLADALSQWRVHRQRMARLQQWMTQHRLLAVVPVDSPAANWPVCKLARQLQPHARIIHLAAPQLWAWAPWRIRKMRRLSDHVLCLLPFEKEWFEQRNMPATFVSHPLFDDAINPQATKVDDLPTGTPRLAILPGSRRAEIQRNWPTMAKAAQQLHQQHPGLHAIVALRNEEALPWLTQATPALQVPAEHDNQQADANAVLPAYVSLICGRTDDVLAWADVVLTVSGTATLQVVAHDKPMVAMYHVNPFSWHLAGRWLVQTRTFTLPNLIHQWLNNTSDKPIPELVPHFGDVAQLVSALSPLMLEGHARQTQRDAFTQIRQSFTKTRFQTAACEALLQHVSESHPPSEPRPSGSG